MMAEPANTGTLQLDDEKHAMLRGDRGPAVAEALRFQIEVGTESSRRCRCASGCFLYPSPCACCWPRNPSC